MFDFGRKKRIELYTQLVQQYIQHRYYVPTRSEGKIKYSVRDGGSEQPPEPGIKFSERSTPPTEDNYSSAAALDAMRAMLLGQQPNTIQARLEKTLDRTFVDCVAGYINEKHLRHADVYRAADIDRRLFSKMMLDRDYRPSKDTAIAVALALRLTLKQTADLLKRAGYVLSHSNKRDVILEYFFAEQIYRLTDINEVLSKLGEKPLGRQMSP